MEIRGKNLIMLGIMLGVLIAFSLEIALAEDLPGAEQAGKVSDIAQNIGDPDYLKEQWMNFLQTSPLGKDIYRISHYPAYLNPVWKYLLGVEFAYTALFFVNLFVWLLVFAYISTAFTVFEVLFKKRVAKFALVLVCMAVISTLGLTKGISNLIIIIVTHIPLFTGWWKAVIWFALGVGWYYLMFVSGHFERLMQRLKEKMKIRGQEAEVKNLGEEVKKSKQRELARMIAEEEKEESVEGEEERRGKELLKSIGEELTEGETILPKSVQPRSTKKIDKI